LSTAIPSRTRLALLLGALIALGPLTIDMYLPALPGIAREFEASASTIQLTLTGTLLGLALGQLFIGPLSDAVGRRKPLLIGTGIHIASSLLIIVAPSIAVFGVLRILQGSAARRARSSRWPWFGTCSSAGRRPPCSPG